MKLKNYIYYNIRSKQQQNVQIRDVSNIKKCWSTKETDQCLPPFTKIRLSSFVDQHMTQYNLKTSSVVVFLFLRFTPWIRHVQWNRPTPSQTSSVRRVQIILIVFMNLFVCSSLTLSGRSVSYVCFHSCFAKNSETTRSTGFHLPTVLSGSVY